MYKFLGNYKIDFDIKLDELKFNSHKDLCHNDKDSMKLIRLDMVIIQS